MVRSDTPEALVRTRGDSPRCHRAGHRDEEGMVTAFVVIFTMAFVLLAGLVLDGGLALSAKVTALDEAQAAARAGAQAINLALYRQDGQVVLEPAAARADALGYLAATGHQGTVTVVGDQVSVVVTVVQPTQILSVAGITHFTETGSGEATAEVGVNGPGT